MEGGNLQASTESAQAYISKRRKQRRQGTLARSDYVGLFPLIEREDWWESMRLLCYTPSHSGGYSFTRADFMEMEIAEIESHIDWLEERRRAEAKK